MTAYAAPFIQDAPDGPGPLTLNDDGKALIWDGTLQRFAVAALTAPASVAVLRTGGGASTIAGATDFAGTPGAGTDGYAIVWDDGAQAFTLAAFDAAGTAAAAVAAHVALSNPHDQYELESNNTAAAILTKLLTVDGAGSGLDADLLDGNSSAAFLLASGATTGATSSRQTFTNGITAPNWQPASNSATALQMRDASGTAFLTGDTTNQRIGIGTTPSRILHIAGDTPFVRLENTGTNGKTLEFFAGTSGVGIGTPTTPAQFVLDATAAESALYLQSGRAVFRSNNLIAYPSLDLIIDSNTDGASGNTVRLRGFNSNNNWETVFSAPNRAGTINAYIVENGGSASVGHGTAPTAVVDIAASTTARASLRMRSGTAPTTPNAGDMWFDGTNLKFYDGSATRTITWT